MRIKTFWIEPTTAERCWLRRYKSGGDGGSCPLPQGYHDFKTFLKDRPACTAFLLGEDCDRPDDDSPMWPSHCDCGYRFQPEDPKQLFHAHLHCGAPDGRLYTLHDVPAGATWHAEWLGGLDEFVGPDGISLHVKLPNGVDWCVDAEASNCARTQYGPAVVGGALHPKAWLGRTHHCWIRHGDPRRANVTVDKRGDTCPTGGGSVLSGSYHGFLRDGYLTGAESS